MIYLETSAENCISNHRWHPLIPQYHLTQEQVNTLDEPPEEFYSALNSKGAGPNSFPAELYWTISSLCVRMITELSIASKIPPTMNTAMNPSWNLVLTHLANYWPLPLTDTGIKIRSLTESSSFSYLPFTWVLLKEPSHLLTLTNYSTQCSFWVNKNQTNWFISGWLTGNGLTSQIFTVHSGSPLSPSLISIFIEILAAANHKNIEGFQTFNADHKILCANDVLLLLKDSLSLQECLNVRKSLSELCSSTVCWSESTILIISASIYSPSCQSCSI